MAPFNTVQKEAISYHDPFHTKESTILKYGTHMTYLNMDVEVMLFMLPDDSDWSRSDSFL